MAGVLVAIGLGSNLDDRRAHLDYAVARLRVLLDDVRVSSVIETEPVGVGPQPPFLNGAVVGRYRGTPRQLLAALLTIEGERGRVRPEPGAARTLDLDLLLFGDRIVHAPDLIVPHPRLRERAFVMKPLAEIAPELVDPVTGRAVADLWQELSTKCP
jgi:2-amino-4-hydroxy-6-hydroxymethyldihydropteridine diphosphokinase